MAIRLKVIVLLKLLSYISDALEQCSKILPILLHKYRSYNFECPKLLLNAYICYHIYYAGEVWSVPWMDTPDMWQFEKQSGDRIISI